jgi:phosphatidylinositol alpha-1,6-mannosyltransferase
MILVSSQTYPPQVGGMENLMHSLCSAFAKSGEQITVFADRFQSREDRIFDKGLDYEVLRFAGPKPLRRRIKARALRKFIQRHNYLSPKLVTDTWKSLEHVDGRLFSNIICLAHGTEIAGQLAAKKITRIRRAFLKARYIIANSHYTATLLLPYIDKPDKIHVIFPGIQPPITAPTNADSIEKTLAAYSPKLITVARLDQRKGQQHIIKILPALLEHFPRLLYIIVGDGPERDHLQQQARDLGVIRNVLFMGTLAGPEKNACLQHSDLFVMPGTAVGNNVEGFGMAYIEAASFGLAAIACNTGGAAEAVLHNQTGLVSEPEDLQQLQNNIFELLNNPDLRARLGSNAQRRSSAFLWDNKVLEYKALLFA